ncbi:hypothetical protein ACF1BE_31340 [Streptomyces sp. NPDC014991]|uniref:hypothetical protein n=1 Tax=Streptomyces sp. NPDC014991 TaxID=3364935 RepID=UPI0037023D6D
MRLLHDRAADSGLASRPVLAVDLTLEVWRSGYELPVISSGSDWMGWAVLAATAPRHEESGTIAIYDPRSGSAMTASPGLPWGRQFSIRPKAGLLAVAPGWLTAAVQPVEAGQTVAVVSARSVHDV